MMREVIPNGCPTSRDDRIKILVALAPRAYRTVIGRAIQALKPHLEVTVVEPDELHAKVARLEPALVISSQPKPTTSEGGPAWVDFRPYDEPSASVCIGGRCARLFEPGLNDLLSVVDEAERLSRTPPGAPVVSCPTSCGNSGEDNSPCGPSNASGYDARRQSSRKSSLR
jgi:hypothetical protein